VPHPLLVPVDPPADGHLPGQGLQLPPLSPQVLPAGRHLFPQRFVLPTWHHGRNLLPDVLQPFQQPLVSGCIRQIQRNLANLAPVHDDGYNVAR